jgi:hypothetical protein
MRLQGTVKIHIRYNVLMSGKLQYWQPFGPGYHNFYYRVHTEQLVFYTHTEM